MTIRSKIRHRYLCQGKLGWRSKFSVNYNLNWVCYLHKAIEWLQRTWNTSHAFVLLHSFWIFKASALVHCNCMETIGFIFSPLVPCRWKKVKGNNMRVSEWQNFHFGEKYWWYLIYNWFFCPNNCSKAWN